MLNLLNIFKRENYSSLNKKLVKQYNQQRPMGAQKYLCYAPFKSIYFAHYGRAIACCYNRTYTLGEYPKQSVKDIWFGAEAEKLRDYMKHDDLSLGCYGCKEHIISGNFDGSKSQQYDGHTLNRNKYPSVMEFELSNICNLECAMCSGDFSSLIRAKREHRPPLHIPYDSKFVDQLEEFIPHLQEVKFYGGEPFLIEIYYEIWERIMKINPKIRISVQTNGTTLNSRLKDIMSKIDFHINLSFDSLQKDNYESIRKNASYERVMENMEYFRQYCKERDTFFGISACAMQQNWRELPDFINFCNDKEVPVYFHAVSLPLTSSISGMPADEIGEVYNYLKGFDFPAITPLQNKNRKHYFDFANHVKIWHDLAVQKASSKKPRNINDIKNMITEFVLNDISLDESERNKKAEKLMSRIAKVEDNLDPVLLNKLLQKIDVMDYESIRDMASYIDKLPAPALIAMAKASNVLKKS